jgi:SAM-dependent methyltransferase
MSFYQRHILPYLVHLAMQQKEMVPFRKCIVGAAEGRLLEIGIGSGLNLPLYGPQVCSVLALEPSPALLRMARKRAAKASIAVDFLEASAEIVPLDDHDVDTVVATGMPLGHRGVSGGHAAPAVAKMGARQEDLEASAEIGVTVVNRNFKLRQVLSQSAIRLCVRQPL